MADGNGIKEEDRVMNQWYGCSWDFRSSYMVVKINVTSNHSKRFKITQSIGIKENESINW